MRFILQKEYDRQHQKSGGPDKLSIEGKLTATFKCRRECRAMESIGVDCQAGESAVCQSVQWAGGAPLKGGAFNPPGKKALAGTPREIKRIAVMRAKAHRASKKNRSVLFREKEAA